MADLNCILIPIKHRFCGITYYNYLLRPSVAHLLHLIVKIKTSRIETITIHNNLIPLPKRYDAITFGRTSLTAHISLRKSYFKKEGLTMNDVTSWLEILSHEVTHTKQIDKYFFLCFGLMPYLIAHAYHYIKASSHDSSDLEQEPIARQRIFNEMNTYLNKNIQPYALARIISDTSITEREKIKRINTLFNKYKATLNIEN